MNNRGRLNTYYGCKFTEAHKNKCKSFLDIFPSRKRQIDMTFEPICTSGTFWILVSYQQSFLQMTFFGQP